MAKLLFRWLVTALAILLVGSVLPGVQVDGLGPAVATAAILGVLNVLVRPILILLTLPLTLVTLGFFLLIINAFLFQLASSFVPGLHVASFGSAFLASLIVSLVTWITHAADGKREGRTVFIQRSGRSLKREGEAIDLKPDRQGNWKQE